MDLGPEKEKGTIAKESKERCKKTNMAQKYGHQERSSFYNRLLNYY